MGHGGKGSRQRRPLVDDEVVTDNWAAIFGQKQPMANMEVNNHCTTLLKIKNVSDSAVSGICGPCLQYKEYEHGFPKWEHNCIHFLTEGGVNCPHSESLMLVK